jgi:multisubunit Na+/H+ antiporter MnhF subunit
MNYWLLAAIVLAVCLVPCASVCFYAGPLAGLAALQVGGGLTTAILILLTESFRRQPFIDLALVMAVVATIGSIIFARILEHEL